MSNSNLIFDSGMHCYRCLTIHTPHAGTLLPFNQFCRPEPGFYMRQHIEPLFRVLTDHYTDKLFMAEMSLHEQKLFADRWSWNKRITQVSFPYSRLFCDVERLTNDPLEEKGLGICYDLPRFVPLRKDVWTLTREQAMALYEEHHRRLALAIRDRGGLLLDCHSFSERDNILSPNAHEHMDIDICLGFNEDKSKPSQVTLDAVAQFFCRHGYRVAFNVPFSNAMVAQTPTPHHSLMIEINKHCYMNEDTLEVTEGFIRLHTELQELYEWLLMNN